MTIMFLESGTDATQGFEFFDAAQGSTSSSAQTHTGPRSIRWSQGYFRKDNIAGLTSGGRVSCWMRLDSITLSAQILIHWADISVTYIQSNASSQIEVHTGSVQATSTLTLPAANQWFHLAMAVLDSNKSMKVWVDGVLFIDVTAISIVQATRVGFGSNAVGHAGYVDDMYVDDVTDLSFPGDIRVTAKLPASDNTVNFDTTVGTGAVNERPLSVTNGQQHAAATDVQENYTLQAASVGDEDLTGTTIVGYTGWVYAKRDSDYQGGYVQTIGSVNDKSSNHTTTVIPTTNDSTGSGYAIIVAFACDDDTGDTTATCADSQGNTYAAGQSVQVATTGNKTGARAAVFIALNATALSGSDTITITHASIGASAAIATEVEGIVTSSALDVSNTVTFGGPTTFTTGTTGTLAQEVEYIIGVCALEGEASDLNSHAIMPLVDCFTNFNIFAAKVGTTGQGKASNMTAGFVSAISKATTDVLSYEGLIITSNTDGSALVAAYKMQAGYGTYGDPKIMLNGTETSVTLTASNALYTKIVDT